MNKHPGEGWRSLMARAMIDSGSNERPKTGALMLDQIIGLILAILALIYLAYAMLRPERF